MRKYAETSHTKKGRKLQIVAFIANSLFSKKKKIQDALFKRYLHKNEASHIPTFYMKMNHFNIGFHVI